MSESLKIYKLLEAKSEYTQKKYVQDLISNQNKELKIEKSLSTNKEKFEKIKKLLSDKSNVRYDKKNLIKKLINIKKDHKTLLAVLNENSLRLQDTLVKHNLEKRRKLVVEEKISDIENKEKIATDDKEFTEIFEIATSRTFYEDVFLNPRYVEKSVTQDISLKTLNTNQINDPDKVDQSARFDLFSSLEEKGAISILHKSTDGDLKLHLSLPKPGSIVIQCAGTEVFHNRFKNKKIEITKGLKEIAKFNDIKLGLTLIERTDVE